MELYADKLRAIRKSQKLTVEELARMVGISRVTLTAWETKKRIPSEAKIRMLAEVLKVTADEISDLKAKIPISDINFPNSIGSCFTLSANDYNKDEISNIFNSLNSLKKKLHDNKLITQGLLSSMLSMFYVKNIDLKYITANHGFLQNLSLPIVFSVQDKTDFDFFPLREAKENEKLDKTVLLSGKPITIEGYIPGTRKAKWGIISKKPIFDEKNQILGITSSYVDITDRKKSERIREILETNINLMKDRICVKAYNPERPIYCNDAYKAIFKNPESCLKDDNLWVNTFIHPDDRETEKKYMRNQSWPEISRFKAIKNDGTVINIERHYHKIEFSGQEYHFFISVDITDITKVNDVSKTKENELSHLIFDKFLNYSNGLVWLSKCSSKGQITFYGSQEKLYGRQMKTASPMQSWIDKILHDECKNAYHKWSKDIDKQIKRLQNSTPEVIKNSNIDPFIYKTIKPDGTTVYIENKTSFISLNNELYLISIERNITENYLLIKQLKQIKKILYSREKLSSCDKEILKCLH
ncbi:MAG TPA: helix-turn-helix domain-containing protein [Victivallales bacterium]|nr:helix-turn-helix domain-containing protein [Victivallales bacterium]